LSQTRYALPQFIKRPYAYAHRKKTSDGSHYEKRGKGEPVCIDDEIPFEIPDSWEWVRLETAYNFIDYRGKTPIKSSDGIRLMTASNVRQGFIDYSREEYISEAEYESRQSRGITHKGDILFTTEAPMGYCALNEMDVCSCGQRVITFQNYYHDALNNALFCQFILSPAFQAQISDNATGTTAKGIKAARLKDLLLPIPPQNEQKRINERIVSLSPIVNDYGNLEDAREHLDAELPDRLRKSVLQLAVQGKLVPQDPADEPASVLLDRIRAERAKLIKGKKLKAPKGGESVIYRASDGGYYEKRGKGEPQPLEVPFDIPDSWEWTRIKDFGFFSSGKTPSKHDQSLYGGDHLWVTSKDMKSFKIAQTGVTLSDKGAEGLNTYPVGTMLFVVRSGILKRFLPIAILDKSATINQDIKALTLYLPSIAVGLAYFIKAFEPYILEELTKSVTTVDSLRFDEFQDMLIPIPPEAEWNRIVAQLNTALGDVITNQ